MWGPNNVRNDKEVFLGGPGVGNALEDSCKRVGEEERRKKLDCRFAIVSLHGYF